MFKLWGAFSREALSGHLLWKTGISFITRVGGVGVAFLAHMLLAKWMGPAGYGEYSYVITWSTVLATLAGLGLTGSVLRLVPEYRVRADWPHFRGIIRGGGQAVIGAGVFIALLGTTWILLTSSPDELTSRLSAIVGFWLVPGFALMNLQSQVLLGLGQVNLAQFPSMVLRQALILVGVWVLSARGATPAASLMVTLLTILLVIVIQGWGSRRHQPIEAEGVRTQFDWPRWRKISLPLLLAGLFAFVINQVDVLMVGTFLSNREVGIYNAAAKTASLASFVTVAVSSVVIPSVAALHAKGDLAGVQRMVGRATHLAFWPSLLIVSGLLLLGKPVLALFGPEFSQARPEMAVLLVGHLITSAHGAAGYLLTVTGHEKWTPWVFGLAAMVNLIFSACLIPFFGTLGAALSTATTMSVSSLLQYGLIAKKTGIRSNVFNSMTPTDIAKFADLLRRRS